MTARRKVACSRCGWSGRRSGDSTTCPRCPAGEGDVRASERGRGGVPSGLEPRVSIRVAPLASTAAAISERAASERRTASSVAGELLDGAVARLRSERK